MEKFLTVDDIGYFRSLAEAKVPQSVLAGASKSSWWGWGTSWLSGSGEAATDEVEDRFGLTESERKLFYRAIDYDERDEKASLSSISPEVSHAVSFFNY